MRWAIVQDWEPGLWFRVRLYSFNFDLDRVSIPSRLLRLADVVINQGWVVKNRYGLHGDQVDVDITPEHLPEAVPSSDSELACEWLLAEAGETPAMVLKSHDAFAFSSRRVRR